MEPSSRLVKELIPAELDLLTKHFDTESKIVEAFRHVFAKYTGEAVNDNRLKVSIQRVVRRTVFLTAHRGLIL
jgi:hypothetical protein